jgi:hypothetical protein
MALPQYPMTSLVQSTKFVCGWMSGFYEADNMKESWSLEGQDNKNFP